MSGNEDMDIEKSETPPSIMSLPTGVDNAQPFQRQRNNVPDIQADDEPDTAPPKRKDFTFKGRHIEMLAIGILRILYSS